MNRKPKLVLLGVGLLLLACLIGAIAQGPAPQTGDDLIAMARVSDGDKHTVEIEWIWRLNGVHMPEYDSVSTVQSPYTLEAVSIGPAGVERADEWTVQARGVDPDGLYSSLEATVIVGGVPPVVEAVRIEVMQAPPAAPGLSVFGQ